MSFEQNRRITNTYKANTERRQRGDKLMVLVRYCAYPLFVADGIFMKMFLWSGSRLIVFLLTEIRRLLT